MKASLRAHEVALGDRIRLIGGLVGVVFSVTSEPRKVRRIFIETDTGGMQAAAYGDGATVSVLDCLEGTIRTVAELEPGVRIGWGSRAATIAKVERAERRFGPKHRKLTLVFDQGGRKSPVQAPTDPVRILPLEDENDESRVKRASVTRPAKPKPKPKPKPKRKGLDRRLQATRSRSA